MHIYIHIYNTFNAYSNSGKFILIFMYVCFVSCRTHQMESLMVVWKKLTRRRMVAAMKNGGKIMCLMKRNTTTTNKTINYFAPNEEYEKVSERKTFGYAKEKCACEQKTDIL